MVKMVMLGVVVLVIVLGGICGVVDVLLLGQIDDLMIVVYCVGMCDFFENIVLVIINVVVVGVDGMWLIVQVSSDGVLVLYCLFDLVMLIDGVGLVNLKMVQ